MSLLHKLLILLPLIVIGVTVWFGFRVAEARERRRQRLFAAKANHPAYRTRPVNRG